MKCVWRGQSVLRGKAGGVGGGDGDRTRSERSGKDGVEQTGQRGRGIGRDYKEIGLGVGGTRWKGD